MTSSVGFVNLGNTCFLNSVLQALCRCPPLVAFLLRDPTSPPPTRPQSKKGGLVVAFHQLLKDIGTEGVKQYQPVGLLTALLKTIVICGDDWYHPRQQADAAECIQYLLDGIHDATYRQVRITLQGDVKTRQQQLQMKALESWMSFFAKEYSPVVEHFYGQYQISIECQTCRNVSTRYEPWMVLKVPIPGGDKAGAEVPTFTDCMNAALASETIAGYACDHCKSPQPATMQTRISKLPNILILSFKRFTNTGSKIRGQIDWDLDALSLAPWTAFQRCPFRDGPIQSTFTTFAVIEHNGSTRGGHYRMFARGNGSWLECDDESVNPVNVSRVISADSYVIFAHTK